MIRIPTQKDKNAGWASHDTVSGKSHFVVERDVDGFAISVHRRGQAPRLILNPTPGAANRARLHLSDQGLVGWVKGGCL